MKWVGTAPDGKRTTYVHGEVLRSEPPKLWQYSFAMGASSKFSRVTIELVPETEATKVSVTHDQSARTIAPMLPPPMDGRAYSPA